MLELAGELTARCQVDKTWHGVFQLASFDANEPLIDEYESRGFIPARLRYLHYNTGPWWHVTWEPILIPVDIRDPAVEALPITHAPQKDVA